MMAIFTEGPERAAGSAACVLCIVFTDITIKLVSLLFSPTVVALFCAGLHLELFHQTIANTTANSFFYIDITSNGTDSNATDVATPYGGWATMYGLQPWMTYLIIAGSILLLAALLIAIVIYYKKAKKQPHRVKSSPSVVRGKKSSDQLAPKVIVKEVTEKDLAAYRAMEEAKTKPGEKYDHKAAMLSKFLMDSNKIVGTTAGKQLTGSDVINIINERKGAYADQEEFDSVSQRNVDSAKPEMPPFSPVGEEEKHAAKNLHAKTKSSDVDAKPRKAEKPRKHIKSEDTVSEKESVSELQIASRKEIKQRKVKGAGRVPGAVTFLRTLSKEKKVADEAEDQGDIRNIVDTPPEMSGRSKRRTSKSKRSKSRPPSSRGKRKEHVSADEDEASVTHSTTKGDLSSIAESDKPTTSGEKPRRKKSKSRKVSAEKAAAAAEIDEPGEPPKKKVNFPSAGRFNPLNLLNLDICTCWRANENYQLPRGWSTASTGKNLWSPMAQVADEQKSLENFSKNWPMVQLDKESAFGAAEEEVASEGSSEDSAASGSEGSGEESERDFRIVIYPKEPEWDAESGVDSEMESAVDREEDVDHPETSTELNFHVRGRDSE